MNELDELRTSIRDFALRRDWEKFHTPKNLAMAICGEAGELAAEFQWLSSEESTEKSTIPIENIELEIADVCIYLLRLCDVLDIDLSKAVRKKIKINESRFPATR